MPRSDWNLVSNSRFNFPENTIESIKIGNLILQLDKLITLQQRKLDLLKQLKKGLLQKMFADKDSKQPVLRFKEFRDDWESNQLGNVFSEGKDRSAKGQLLSVSISKGVYPFNENERKNNSSKDKSHYKSVNIGDIAYNSMRMWQGAEGVSKYKGIVSPAYTILSPKETNISDFFGFMFKRTQVLHTFQAHSQGLTPDTWNLKYPLIKTIKVNIPSSKEQKIISNLFVKLNFLISMQEQEFTKYQSIKKALLQQMFI